MLIVWFATCVAIYRNLYFSKYAVANLLSGTLILAAAHQSSYAEPPFGKVGFGHYQSVTMNTCPRLPTSIHNNSAKR